MAVTLTLAASARSSGPTEHPGKISSGPTTLFGVPGITGHTICLTLATSLFNLYVTFSWLLNKPGLVFCRAERYFCRTKGRNRGESISAIVSAISAGEKWLIK